MYAKCPKCGHAPLPDDQAFPAACPACGVILARVADAPAVREQARRRRENPIDHSASDPDRLRWRDLFLHVPDRVDSMAFGGRFALLVGLAVWGVVLARLDVDDGSIGSSFLHRPLLVFHEAGHVIFRPFGEWMTIAGGSIGQLLMPAILAVALLWKNKDPFGAAVGLWLFGVSLIDLAPYIYDALEPQLVLLNGSTGEAGGHDWIYLLDSMRLIPRAQVIGLRVHGLGEVVVALAIGWGAWVLRRQSTRLAGHVLRKE
jgi:predicted RNA-binding Zn-ribbon protein involved in translation (DUF1610 family)